MAGGLKNMNLSQYRSWMQKRIEFLNHAQLEAAPSAKLRCLRWNWQLAENIGGGGRNRTGVHGFAGRCMTTLPPRRMPETRNSEGYRNGLFLGILERETSLELATLTLARLRSTN